MLLALTLAAAHALTGDAPADGDAHPYVVRMANDEALVCSGVVIAPDRVLTAGSCGQAMADGGGRVVIPAGDGATEIAVTASVSAPDWPDPEFPVPAIVTLAAPLDVDPVVVRDEPLRDKAVGKAITLVGWGTTGTGELDDGTRRRLDTTIGLLDTAWIFTPSGDGACVGDEGGAVLVDGDTGPELVGVIAGHVGLTGSTAPCGDASTYAGRVDAMLDFLVEHGAITAVVLDDTDAGDTDDGEGTDGGCGCATGATGPAWGLVLVGAALRRRRRG